MAGAEEVAGLPRPPFVGIDQPNTTPVPDMYPEIARAPLAQAMGVNGAPFSGFGGDRAESAW
ncbi:MAG TPA: hypothetical protein VNL71_25390, partial [Chloroflexota bacterium]|nr:hypothetical protein [Chloroflexota bacterium]